MEEKEDIIYFELNNWFSGEHYPDTEPFKTWCLNAWVYFGDRKWCIENKLCVVETYIDMSIDWCITAKREWVEKNCPELLTEYTKFLRTPDKDGKVYGRECEFLKYSEKNVGLLLLEDN